MTANTESGRTGTNPGALAEGTRFKHRSLTGLYRRLRNLTESAVLATANAAMASARGLAPLRLSRSVITAGGEFHRTLRTIAAPLASSDNELCRKAAAQAMVGASSPKRAAVHFVRLIARRGYRGASASVPACVKPRELVTRCQRLAHTYGRSALQRSPLA